MYKKKFLIISIVAFLLIAILKPLGLDQNQAIVLASLVAAVILWASSGLHKSIVCALLILSFSIFSNTKFLNIISFIYSDTMLLIIFTTLLSVGIMNSGAINGFVERIFVKTGNNIFTILTIPYLLGIVLVFIIPQAFARVIIMGSIYSSLITFRDENEHRAKRAILFNVFFAVTMTYMMFINGDIVLNGAALSFSTELVNSELNQFKWFTLMALPTLVASVLSILLVRFIFKDDLKYFNSDMIVKSKTENINKSSKMAVILLMLIVILLWIFEDVHHIKPWIVSMVATIIMFAMKLLKKDDLKSVNPHFLLFLTTVFSIGKVLGQAGITEIIFQKLSLILANPNSPIYLLLITVVVMVLHLSIGSSVATMSVVLPILVPMAESQGINGIVITLLTYITVNVHFLLPFHHATMMIGSGKEYYPDNYMTKLGTYMSAGVLVFIFLIYIPWWKLMGLL